MIETDNARAVIDAVAMARCKGNQIALVPTMGFLHAGHQRLAEAARAENDLVIMSIFVNPTQFGLGEDFEKYPRDLEHDQSVAQNVGVDILFTPDETVMYPQGPRAQTVWVDPSPLDHYLCGASRPGHFRGVATVVAKLFHMTQPDTAYFGQKDAQQAIIVQRMAQDLSYPVTVKVIPTVREPDGLALSSRNVYLSARERQEALALSRALDVARTKIAAGEHNAAVIERAMRDSIEHDAPTSRIDYVTVSDLNTLEPCVGSIPSATLVALAVYVGTTRLIDNVIVQVRENDVTFS